MNDEQLVELLKDSILDHIDLDSGGYSPPLHQQIKLIVDDLRPVLAEHTVEQLLAEIADSAAREADFRNRAEVAEAKLAQVWEEGYEAGFDDGRGTSIVWLEGDDRINPYTEVPS